MAMSSLGVIALSLLLAIVLVKGVSTVHSAPTTLGIPKEKVSSSEGFRNEGEAIQETVRRQKRAPLGKKLVLLGGAALIGKKALVLGGTKAVLGAGLLGATLYKAKHHGGGYAGHGGYGYGYDYGHGHGHDHDHGRGHGYGGGYPIEQHHYHHHYEEPSYVESHPPYEPSWGHASNWVGGSGLYR